MQTIHILSKLVNSIESNPTAISLLPWEDIRLCLSAELNCRSDIYPTAQLHKVQDLFSEMLADAQRHASANHTQVVIGLFRKILTALQFMPELEHVSHLIEQANFDHACLRHCKNNTIIVLGDSHVNFFSGNEELCFIPIGRDINTCRENTPYPFTPLHLGPCLAYNCYRYNTGSSFREKLDYLKDSFIQPQARILCCLGEIDLRVHVFKQAELQDRDYREIVDEILEQYTLLLLQLQEQGYQVACWGPIASQSEHCPLDPRFPRSGTEAQRNMATEYFNQQLFRICSDHGIPYLSIFTQMITPDYLTKECYLSPDQCHLGQKALPLLKTELKKLL